MKGNIVLIGCMGTGKSTVSKELARLTGLAQVETDEEIEKAAGISIPEIFARYGEPRFRDMETEAIMRVAARSGLIISTGGGAILREENVRALRENGVIVYLTASAETIIERTRAEGNRPLLNVSDPLKKINEILDARKTYYERACGQDGVRVDTEGKSPMEIAREILGRMKGE